MKRIISSAVACLLACPASAQLLTTGAGKGTPGGASTFAVAYEDAQSIAAAGFTNATFATVNFGATGTSRKIVVTAFNYCGGCGAFSGITIGGVTGTLAIANDTANISQEVWFACVPTGTSGSVVVNGTNNAVAITVYQITGESGGCSTAPSSTATYAAAGAQPLSLPVTVTAGGAAIIQAGDSGVAAAPTFTWTNTTAGAGDGSTSQTTGTTVQASGAHATSSATVTVSSTQSLSFGGQVVSATWGP